MKRTLAVVVATAALAGCASSGGGLTAAATPNGHRRTPQPTVSASVRPSASATPTTAPSGSEGLGVLPLPVTPGVFDPRITDANVATTVCAGTGKYRPSVAYTEKVKRDELSTPVGQSTTITVTAADLSPTAPASDPHLGKTYTVPGYEGFDGLSPSSAGAVELDHYVALSDGGDGYDPANLWPEPHTGPIGFDGQAAGSLVKDNLEWHLYLGLCRKHSLSLTQVRGQMAGDWYRSYVTDGRPPGYPASG